MAEPAIAVEALEKRFVVRVKRGRLRRERREVAAVDGIRFEIERGSIVGYLGPNGAGKSTTVKMLTGILVPSAGRIRVAGLDPSRQRVELARRIGVVFGQRSQLWWDLPLARLLRPAAPHLPRARGTAPREPRSLHRGARAGGVPRHAGAPALARPADARRADRGAAARPRARLPRRADDRARRRREGGSPRVPHRGEPRAGGHGAADDARSRRHRAALLAAADHRPRPSDLGRRHRRAEASTGRSGRSWSTSRSPRRRSRCARRPHRRPAPVARLPPRRGERRRADRRRRGRARLVDVAIEETEIEEIVRRIYAAEQPRASDDSRRESSRRGDRGAPS